MKEKMESSNSSFKKLKKVIFENSQCKDDFKIASQEWKPIGFYTCDDHCACGHAILYISKIKNVNTEAVLKIGSTCIKKFGNEEVDHFHSYIMKTLSKPIYFGKYKGKTYFEILENDKNYLQWLVKQKWFKEKNSSVVFALSDVIDF